VDIPVDDRWISGGQANRFGFRQCGIRSFYVLVPEVVTALRHIPGAVEIEPVASTAPAAALLVSDL
jgi:hypothetical protein